MAPVLAYRPAFDLVLIVGSLGAPQALRQIVSALPSYFPASVVAVQHRTTSAEQITVELLRRRSALDVRLADEGQSLELGTVYVTPAERQLVIDDSLTFRLANGAGSTADPLFESAARRLGPRVLAVVLSGMNLDGSRGVVAVKSFGGRVLAQDRATARCFAMPAGAIATGCVDFVLPVDRIAQAIVALTLAPGAVDFFRVALPPWTRLAG
jgi:two-component system chemotaxis response regulator CheB